MLPEQTKAQKKLKTSRFPEHPLIKIFNDCYDVVLIDIEPENYSIVDASENLFSELFDIEEETEGIDGYGVLRLNL